MTNIERNLWPDHAKQGEISNGCALNMMARCRNQGPLISMECKAPLVLAFPFRRLKIRADELINSCACVCCEISGTSIAAGFCDKT